MVGGEGRRLRPLTNHMPKSLLQIANRPILEHTLLLLRGFGITDITLAVNYLASMIEDRFGNGSNLDIRISYQHERYPLGTAGALGQLPQFDDTVLMMNGDVITDIDLSEMLARHRSHSAAMTVASKVMYTDLSLGVLDVGADGLIEAYREKPRLEHRFGIGIYLVEPIVNDYITPGERVDVPELIARLLGDGQRVACYDHAGKWTDIGLPEDYARAQQEALDIEVAASA
jgi:mannose-1-phosphate guanylyltransferase/phosphomannomutase